MSGGVPGAGGGGAAGLAPAPPLCPGVPFLRSGEVDAEALTRSDPCVLEQLNEMIRNGAW